MSRRSSSRRGRTSFSCSPRWSPARPRRISTRATPSISAEPRRCSRRSGASRRSPAAPIGRASSSPPRSPSYGAPFPDKIGDEFVAAPLTSYGTQKAISELLLADYSRRGFFDGIGLRLPTICVRPGAPNKAASGFFSGIIREPLAGKEAILPVGDEVRHWHASPRAAVEFLLRAAELDLVAARRPPLAQSARGAASRSASRSRRCAPSPATRRPASSAASPTRRSPASSPAGRATSIRRGRRASDFVPTPTFLL